MNLRKSILSFPVDTGSYSSFLARIIALGRERRSSYVCLANVHMVVEARRDEGLAAVVAGADLVTPDGMPLVKVLKLLHGFSQERVAGMDLLPDLLKAAAEEGLSVFLYGSTDKVLEAMTRRLRAELPHLRLAGAYSPPFRALSEAERAEEVRRINGSGAQLVLVALGCPKQEKWMAAHRGRVEAAMVGVGGAFSVYAGLQRRAPRFMQRLALEWFYRLCQEPRRLFARYFVTNSTFLLLMGWEMASRIWRRQPAVLGEAPQQLEDVPS